MKKALLTGALALSAFSASAATEGTEFEFWHSLSGGAPEMLCEAFNVQSEHTVNCIYQGDYDTAMQRRLSVLGVTRF